MENCRLCNEVGGSLIWSGADCRIVAVSDPELPGFCRVIWQSHIAEMSSLNRTERNQLMRIVVGVEEAIVDTMQPAKINMAALGNQVPHLHWHIIQRYEDDAFFPDSIWSMKRRPVDDNVIRGRQVLAKSLNEVISSRVNDWITA